MTEGCNIPQNEQENALHGGHNTGIEKFPQNELNNIRHVIAVLSGKGGVGKSSVAALLAVNLAKEAYKVGVLDADITGPSIPRMFGIHSKVEAFEFGILPAKTSLGIEVMSLNLLVEREDDPVIWRGPLIAGAIRQFWTDVVWGELDYLVVDLPPGTGDAPLTVMQSLPLDGIVIVSSPQELAVMVVKKAIRMASIMKAPVLGLIENMSYVVCPKCGETLQLFGPPKGVEVAKTTGIPYLGALPIDPKLAELCDLGQIEQYANPTVTGAVDWKSIIGNTAS